MVPVMVSNGGAARPTVGACNRISERARTNLIDLLDLLMDSFMDSFAS
jgi:hypothetical protein